MTNLATGVYTLPDVARILRLPLPKLRRWVASAPFSQEEDTSFGVSSSGIQGIGIEKHLNFLSLIEVFTIIQMRDLGVSFQTIRNARLDLKSLTRSDYPFATRDLLVDGRKLLTEAGEDVLVELGTNGQSTFRKVIEPFCERIDFEENSQMAERFYPDGRTSSVVIDPRLAFGRPILSGTGIPTESLFSLHRGGEDTDSISAQYEIPERLVIDAIHFETNRAA